MFEIKGINGKISERCIRNCWNFCAILAKFIWEIGVKVVLKYGKCSVGENGSVLPIFGLYFDKNVCENCQFDIC